MHSTAAMFRRGLPLGIALTLALCSVVARGEEPLEPGGPFRNGSWPFAPPKLPAPPAVNDAAWCRNDIDRFVLFELETRGLRPSPPADKANWLRRATFDLTGLPPTVAEQEAFFADESPLARERVVDRLLGSPAYGERAAQFWLDLVRYAETDGFKADGHRPNAYKYRDWVIDAYNQDLPYSTFIAWQLAGDELVPQDPRALAATGYLRLHPDEYNAANLEQRRQEILDDITDTTSLALLGMTVGCARCHDHKFDEITHRDYYRLQAFFAPLSPRDDVVAASASQRDEYATQQAAWEQATQTIRNQIEALIAGPREALRSEALTKFRDEIQRCVKVPSGERSPYESQIAAMAMKQAVEKDSQAVARLSDDEKKKYDSLQSQLKEFDPLKPAPLPTLMAASDVGPAAPPTFVLATGNWRTPIEEVQPGFPAFLHEPTAVSVAGDLSTAPSAASSATTGRRSYLARWFARSDHPLATRVAVNRLWQQHFGVGLAPSGNDFGIQGDAVTHPQLLDWLAVELIERGGSLKQLHRLIMTSATYLQGVSPDAALAATTQAIEVDPQNHYLWRARRRRLEGEALRDAMLLVSGELNRRPGGPSARPELPEGVGKSYAWQPDDRPADRNRRSIYVLAKRNMRFPMFDAFDAPDMHQSCPRRSNTTTAPQALLMLNGRFSWDRARHWAESLTSQSDDDPEQFVELAYRQAYCRQPRSDEREAALAFIQRQAEVIGGDGAAARTEARVDFCHAIFNSNEFLYVD